MREIKFRAWDTIQKQMHYSGFELNNQGQITKTYGIFTPAVKLILSQFTGLHDRNGKEIWEGDVVRYSEHYFGDSKEKECIDTIEWDDETASYPWKLIDTGFMDGPHWREVIGNIYENPELIST